jgi:hypothetical protein
MKLARVLTVREARVEFDAIRHERWVIDSMERGYVRHFTDAIDEPPVHATIACEYALWGTTPPVGFRTAKSRDAGLSYMYWTRGLVMQFGGPMLATEHGPVGKLDAEDFLRHMRRSFYAGSDGWCGDWQLALEVDECAAKGELPS